MVKLLELKYIQNFLEILLVLTNMVIIILNQVTEQKDGLIIKVFVMPLIFLHLGIVGYTKLPDKVPSFEKDNLSMSNMKDNYTEIKKMESIIQIILKIIRFLMIMNLGNQRIN